MEEKQLNEKESLDLIASMINQAKDAYHDTGVSAILWGIVITVCSLEKFSELQFGYTLPFDIYLLTFVAVIPQVLINIREKKQRRVKTYDDDYMAAIWLAFGIGIFLLIVIINVVFAGWQPVFAEYSRLTGHPPSFHFNEYIASLFLLLYGIPTFITGKACHFKPMLLGGIFCWICCIIALFTNLKIDLLLTACAAIAAWLVPGIIIEKNYRKAKRELAQKNV